MGDDDDVTLDQETSDFLRAWLSTIPPEVLERYTIRDVDDVTFMLDPDDVSELT